MIVGTLLDPEQHHDWPGIRALLEQAACHGDDQPYDPRDLVWLAIEERQIVAVLTACITTTNEIHIVNAGGCRAAEWVPLMDAKLTEWAGAAGARAMTCRGRKGWGRLSAGLGWKVVGQDGKSVLYEKVLQ